MVGGTKFGVEIVDAKHGFVVLAEVGVEEFPGGVMDAGGVKFLCFLCVGEKKVAFGEEEGE